MCFIAACVTLASRTGVCGHQECAVDNFIHFPAVVRFGAFEINLRTGELRRHGLRVRLRRQAFQVLAALLERPGRLRTRDELRRRLWPDSTFVDFERSLNKAVHALRCALDDSAGAPRFIETVSRHGYRFIGYPEQSPGSSAAYQDPARINSLAVLPLQAGSEPELSWVAEEITELITDMASSIRGLRVLAVSTVRHYTDKDPQTTARDLGVRAVLSGHIVRRGNVLVLHMELIDTIDGCQIWGEQSRKPWPPAANCGRVLAEHVSDQIRLVLGRHLQNDDDTSPSNVLPDPQKDDPSSAIEKHKLG
jgi:DNA-binding winged helix-turn-helix (wHTH) protein